MAVHTLAYAFPFYIPPRAKGHGHQQTLGHHVTRKSWASTVMLGTSGDKSRTHVLKLVLGPLPSASLFVDV